MISDLTPSGNGIMPNVPCGMLIADKTATDMVQAALNTRVVQPVQDVAEYLADRTPQADYEGEEHLLVTLPHAICRETVALVKACKLVASLTSGRDGIRVEPACKKSIAIHHRWSWKLKTFRAKYDLWQAKQDWTVLVNKSKAPIAWREADETQLPEAFLVLCEQAFGKFARRDGKRQAWLSICRNWETGKNKAGDKVPVAGYEDGWAKRDAANLPPGWSYSNILRRIEKRARFKESTRAALHEGESAMREFLPQNIGTRKGLRFLEKITFDDVRMDWFVFNTVTGQAEEMWLLVARDEATAMVLGFVMHPATVDENGKASHLGARHMKELAAYLLERYPLAPYVMHWVVERGTATLAEGVKAALGELFNNRIRVHYTSMISGLSPTGYKQKAKGNSRGKASHESHNRLFHTQASYLPGQTGAHYAIRPADLDARVAECKEIWNLRQRLPEHKRGDERYPLTVLQTEARTVIQEFCIEQNFRVEHKLEGFDEVLEWFDGKAWQPRETAPAGAEFRTRMQRPVERAVDLIRLVEKWDRVSPAIIKTFLEHTERTVEVNAKGEIHFDHQKKPLIFRNAGVPLNPGTKALAYHHSDDPEFLHLTSGDGRVLGTWCQRGRTRYQDQEALAQAMRYTAAARSEAMNIARELAAPQVAELETMRDHNANLEQFVVTAEVPAALGTEKGSAIGTMLAGVGVNQAAEKKASAKRESNLKAFKGDVSDLAEPAPQEFDEPETNDFSAEGLL